MPHKVAALGLMLTDAISKDQSPLGLSLLEAMTSSVYSEWPPKLDAEQKAHIISEINLWSIIHGLAVRPAPSFVPPRIDPYLVLATTAPITIFPSPFPRSCFQQALKIQNVYNQLYAAIANDEVWLKAIVEVLSEVDDFISKLWHIHLAVKDEGYTQNLTLGIFRSDYMVHVNPSEGDGKSQIKQVEFNTIASSFGGLSDLVCKLHRTLEVQGTYPQDISVRPSEGSTEKLEDYMPANNAIDSLAAGLAQAHAEYEKTRPEGAPPACIIMIVQPLERNPFDQELIISRLRAKYGIPSFRLGFSSVFKHTEIPNISERPLYYHCPHSQKRTYEVSVVYFRAGYAPNEYPDDNAWAARLHLERSLAIKCPSILTHLAGSKKIQQELATPGSDHLNRFIRSPDVSKELEETFTNIFPLDDSIDGKKAREIALDEKGATNYVLKPQREGGGNNIYGAAIPSFLRSIPESHWKGYILMELIHPPALNNMVLRNGECMEGAVIGELGIYGAVLWEQGGGSENSLKETDEFHCIFNTTAGYLLRTKSADSEEGGVAAGFGAVDSCLLVDS